MAKKFKLTRSPSSVPDDIEVRWELPGGRQVWWRAKFMPLRLRNTGKRVEDVTAFLRYEAAHGFPSTLYQVSFRTPTTLEHVIRNNVNITSTWRARQTKGRSSPKQIALTKKSRSRGKEEINEEVNTLWKQIVRNTTQLDDLRRLLLQQQTLHLGQELDYTTRREKEVLAFRTHRMAIELRKAPRLSVRPHQGGLHQSSTLIDRSNRGITRTNVRVSADCEQRVFEMIAKRIHEKSETLHAVPFFRPEYELTQLPTEGCCRFSITLGSFSDLCQCIGIDSSSDRISMMRRYGMSRGEGTVRILGSLNQDHGDDSESMEFFVGNSCGHHYEEGGRNTETLLQAIWAISRENSAWNNDDRRYNTPLKTECLNRSRSVRQACHNQDLEKGLSFEVLWKRAKGVNGRMWSRAITHSDIIAGKIEIVLPCIIISGSVLCDEYTTSLTDEILKEVIQ